MSGITRDKRREVGAKAKAKPVRVLDYLRQTSKVGEPLISTVTRAVQEYRRAKERDEKATTNKAAARVSQVAHVLRSYLPKLGDEGAIAGAISLLDVRARTLEPGEGSLADPDVLVAHSADWSAAEVEEIAAAYSRELRATDWPAISVILDGLRASRGRRVDRIRQDLGVTALPSSVGEHPGDRERIDAARKAAWAEFSALLVGPGRNPSSTQEAMQALGRAKAMPVSLRPGDGRTPREATAQEKREAEAALEKLRAQVREMEGER